MKPDLCFVVIEVADNLDVGQHKMLGVSLSRKSNSQLLADRAVRPVAAQNPFGVDLFDASGTAQLRANPGIILLQPDKLGVALDFDSEFCDALFEEPLGFVLRHSENE